MSEKGEPEYRWTYMGIDVDSGYGPWRYQVFSSDDGAKEKLKLFANAETDDNARVTSVTFQPCLNEEFRTEDRRVVQTWDLRNGRWTFVGVFDGHAGHETVDYSVAELPLKVRHNLEAMLEETEDTSLISPERISSLLADTISAFDGSLLDDLFSLFPGGLEGVLRLSNDEIEEILDDADRGGQNLQNARRCMQGSTVLIALVDPSGGDLWVANLGDCEAVLGTRLTDGSWKATSVTSNHNGGNTAEIRRIMDEHPGEDECILKNRVLGVIAVTRALGDYIFKIPATINSKIFPEAIFGTKYSMWVSRNITPPYISNLPDVHHHQLSRRRPDEGMSTAASNMFLIMCSDGLTYVYPKETNNIEHWVQVVGSAMERGDSPALVLLWHALGGDADSASQYMTLESFEKWMDDITIAVLAL